MPTVSDTILQYLLDPVLTVLALVLCTGFAIRTAAFLAWASKTRKGLPAIHTVLAALFPFHRGLKKAPVFALTRYVFHACLFAVPVWETGHIVLLRNRLGISYPALPPGLVDTMTLAVVGIGLCFGARRIFDPGIRKRSSLADYYLILVAVTPFATGFCYAHGIDAGIPAVTDTLLTLHVASGTLMLVTALFLFVRTRLIPETCVGCAACAEACPTGTLEAKEAGDARIFFYSHYQCICCGGCQAACPEGAARLSHAIGINHFLALFAKQPIGEKPLTRCLGCDELFVPDPQLAKLKTTIESAGLTPPGTLDLCTRCKKLHSRHPLAVP